MSDAAPNLDAQPAKRVPPIDDVNLDTFRQDIFGSTKSTVEKPSTLEQPANTNTPEVKESPAVSMMLGDFGFSIDEDQLQALFGDEPSKDKDDKKKDDPVAPKKDSKTKADDPTAPPKDDKKKDDLDDPSKGKKTEPPPPHDKTGDGKKLDPPKKDPGSDGPRPSGEGPGGDRPGHRLDRDALLKRLDELELKVRKETEEQVEKATKYIEDKGKDPKAAILESVKNNHVTFLGEIHTVGTENPHREMVRDALKEMPAGSRFATELPDVLKPVFDKFNASKKGSDFEIPDKLDGPYAKEALELLRKVKEKSPDIIDMWKAARDNGIKVVPIDNASSVMPDSDPNKAAETARRDQNMKDHLLKMVKDDPMSKVIAELGNLHGTRRSNDKDAFKSAATLLSEDADFKKLGGKIQTFYAQIAEGHGVGGALFPATLAMDKPRTVGTKQDGKPNDVGKVPIFGSPRVNAHFGHNLDSFDNVIVYPPSKSFFRDLERGAPGEGPNRAPRVSERSGDDLAVQRAEVIKERAKDIADMKGKTSAPIKAADQYVAPDNKDTPPAKMSPEDWKKIKEEYNAHGTAPEKALGEAMKDSRVLGIGYGQIDWKTNLEFVNSTLAELKKNGATHAVFDMPPETQRLLDKFSETGVVDRKLLEPGADMDYKAAYMQAALNNGLKIVAAGRESPIDNGKSQERADAVQKILSDKNAKVVMIGDDNHIASGKDREGRPTTVQRLKDAGVAVKTAIVNDTSNSDNYAAKTLKSLKAPVAVSTDKAATIGTQQGGFCGHSKLNQFDYLVLFPEVKEK
ncbi:MAG: hypothetical protein K2X93_15785 [Candidatus Obscuribacterales bacterium]|nr:hypothetical protein [Candidatus Obscuribacterales bacterium]